MAQENIPLQDTPEIYPQNSRFAIRWDRGKREFPIAAPGTTVPLLTLDYRSGRYVYAALRGQVRIEQALQDTPRGSGVLTKDRLARDLSSSGLAFSEDEINSLWQQMRAQGRGVGDSDPTVTRHHLYHGTEPFVHTEHSRTKGADALPRAANREEDCHVAADAFIKFAGLDPVHTGIDLVESPSYASLTEEIERHALPQLVEVAMKDPKVKRGKLVETHSCIVLGRTRDEFICFEKAGTALPWRLTTLRETYSMYERDFKQANQGRPHVFWTVNELLPKIP